MAHGYWVASFLSIEGYRAHMAESAKALTRFAARILTGGVQPSLRRARPLLRSW